MFIAGCSVSEPVTEEEDVRVDQFLVAANRVGGVTSRAELSAGVPYIVTVEGTVSLYGRSQWSSVCAGTPKPRPLFEGGSASGRVGDDPAWEFAVPSGSSVCSRGAPVPRSGWVYKTRANDDWTLAETDAAYDPGHAYTYPIVGQGEPLTVQIREGAEFDDNYGAFRVTISHGVGSVRGRSSWGW